MEVILTKKPKKPIIIEGLPGMGFVGTVASEYLIEHLKAESIGYLWDKKLPPLAIVHGKEVRRLLEIFYAKKKNLLILTAISGIKDMEWDVANAVVDLAKQVKAKEIISLEGVGAPVIGNAASTYGHSTNRTKNAKLKRMGVHNLPSGAILGVSGALMLNKSKTPITFFFATTQSNMPDSNAAAELIKVLDTYLRLRVDIKPLLSEAEKFEGQLKAIMQKGAEAVQLKKKKDSATLPEELSYVG